LGDISEIEDHQGGGEDGEDGNMSHCLEGEVNQENAKREVYDSYMRGENERKKESKY
jgi:hypothetical protein